MSENLNVLGGRPIHVSVRKRKGETDEDLIKRFKKKFSKSGLTREVKDAMYYEKPSDKRRRKKSQAIKQRLKEEKKQAEREERYRKIKMKRRAQNARRKRQDRRSFNERGREDEGRSHSSRVRAAKS